MGNNISKTVISQCLEWLNIPEFVCDFLDYRKQKLTLAASIYLFVEAQLSDRKDPDSIVENLIDSTELQALTGLTSLSASRFSRKLSELPTWLLQYLFEDITRRIYAMLQQSGENRGLKKELFPLSIITLCRMESDLHDSDRSRILCSRKAPNGDGAWTVQSVEKDASVYGKS